MNVTETSASRGSRVQGALTKVFPAVLTKVNMFYSHQLLSKKHPMGQIWIAATIRANINRTKAAKINIAQICKQILNPPVPLALRLSGILMGGIVQIYKRKVFFLYEDMNAFLIKIKIEAARTDEDRTKLPKRKNRAKYEKITMGSSEIPVAESIERPMREPSVPLQVGGNTLDEMFFIFPDAVNVDDNSSPRDQFQAAIEDITLPENTPYSPHGVGGQRKSGSSISADSILGPLDDILPEFQLPGQRPSQEVGPVEDCVPDVIIPDDFPPDLSGALHTIFEEQLPEPETNLNSVILPEAGSSQPKRGTRSARSITRKRNARVLMYDDETEISKKTFAAWIQDTSDIAGRKCVSKVPGKAKEINKERFRAVQENWNLPSVCVKWNVKYRPEPTWAPPLQEMWRRLVIPTPNKPADSGKKGDATAASPTSSGSKQNSPMEIDFPVPEPLETDFPANTDIPMETGVQIVPENLPHSPLVEADHHSLGSVEKLREALQTPSTGSREDIFGNKFGLRTPALFAPLTTDGKSSKRSMSASYGGSLSYDSEGEPPTSGKSKRRITDSSVKDVGRSMSPVSGELPELNIQQARRASGKSDMIDYFASGDFQAGILAQSQILEDTSGSTQPVPADSINPTTIVIAKLLRAHFNKLNEADVYEASVNNLTAGLDKTRAARMFYQICVLASNESIIVNQADPYGDIILKRGVTL